MMFFNFSHQRCEPDNNALNRFITMPSFYRHVQPGVYVGHKTKQTLVILSWLLNAFPSNSDKSVIN